MKIKSVLASLLLFFFTLLSMADESTTGEVEEEILSARELLQGCEEGAAPGAPNQYCMRYVFGLVQTLDMLQQQGESPKIFCINPHVIGLEDVTENITKWLRGKEDRLNEDAYILVTEALNQMYPCQIVDT